MYACVALYQGVIICSRFILANCNRLRLWLFFILFWFSFIPQLKNWHCNVSIDKSNNRNEQQQLKSVLILLSHNNWIKQLLEKCIWRLPFRKTRNFAIWQLFYSFTLFISRYHNWSWAFFVDVLKFKFVLNSILFIFNTK